MKNKLTNSQNIFVSEEEKTLNFILYGIFVILLFTVLLFDMLTRDYG